VAGIPVQSKFKENHGRSTLINRVLEKINNNTEYSRILFIYRYSSFIVTSVFFMLNNSDLTAGKNGFIVCCIGLSAVIINYLYTSNLDRKNIVLFLLFIETVFNVIILIPSGGIESPYIWYSLNTILISSITQKRIICWLNLFIYLFGSTGVFYALLKPYEPFVMVLQKESNLLLSLILITAALNILTFYYKQTMKKNKVLEEANKNLVLANNKIKESMDYIMELYQAVHLLTTQQDKENLIGLIIEYTKKITKLNEVFFIRNDDSDGNEAGSDKLRQDKQSGIRTKLLESLDKAGLQDIPEQLKIDDKILVIAPVKCHCRLYGIIVADASNAEDRGMSIREQLKFISELGTISLEKFELEQINKDLLINEEQNRIANEIHDEILQKLFVISSGIYNLTRQLKKMNAKKMEAELSMIRTSVNNTMSELRSIIYGYSWKKQGYSNFLADISGFVESVKKYHGIDISFELRGDQELLSLDQKKALYRIISEGIGNAIRHGNARQIFVTLIIGNQYTLLEISDNGMGFNISDIEDQNKMGMGIKNICILTRSLQGNIQINSEPGHGTVISIKIPNRHGCTRKEIV